MDVIVLSANVRKVKYPYNMDRFQQSVFQDEGFLGLALFDVTYSL